MGASERSARFAFLEDTGTTDASAGTQAENWSTEVGRRFVACLPISDPRFEALRSVYPGAQFALALPFDSVANAWSPANRARWLANRREFDILGVLDPTGQRRELHIALVQRFTQRAVTA